MDWAEIYARLRADRNDPLPWGALEGRVRGLARTRLGQRGEDVVEDVTADTCSTVALNFEKARGAETFGGFVLGQFLNVARRASLERGPTPLRPDAVDVAAPLEPEYDDEALSMLERCLADLPERDRRAVELRYVDELSAADIAVRLGVREGNARRIVFNGLARLRRCAAAWLRERNEG